MAGSGNKSGPFRGTMVVVFFTLLIDLLGFTVILPLLPSMLEYYGTHDESGLYNATLWRVDSFRRLINAPESTSFNIVLFGGLVGSLYSLLQFFASPLIGAASDIYGRKPMLLLSIVGVMFSYVLWTVSYSFPVFVAARLLAGMSKGTVSLSTAIASDVTSVEQRPKAMAIIGVAFSLGFIFGPSIGAWFSSIGRSAGHSFAVFQYPAYFALVTGVLTLLLVGLFFKETLPQYKRKTSSESIISRLFQLTNPVSLFRYSAVSSISKQELSNLRRMSIAYFLYLFLFSGLEYSLTFLVHQRFDYTRAQQGRMFLFIGTTMALVQGGYLRRRPPGTEKRTALTGMASVIPGMLLVGWALNPIMLYSGLLLFSFGAGTVVSSLTTIASQFGKGDEKGKIMGIFRSLGALARAFGPFIACSVFWSYGACICYMAGGLAVILPILILFTVKTTSTAVLKKQE